MRNNRVVLRFGGSSFGEEVQTMAKKHSKYQQRVIQNYYDNREAISLQRVSELVTDLYLAEGKGRQRIWQRVTAALEKLDVKKPHIEHLVAKDDPALLARLVQELMAKP